MKKDFVVDMLESKQFASYVKSRIKEEIGRIPSNSLVAGQAVSTMAMEYIWGKAGPINDVDIFVPISNYSSLKGIEDKVLPTLTSTIGHNVLQHNCFVDMYGQVISFRNSAYKILSSLNYGKANYVIIDAFIGDLYEGDIREFVSKKFWDILPAQVIAAFDLNCVQIGYVTNMEKIVFTEEFARFMKTRQIEPLSHHTPSRTLMRAIMKRDSFEEEVWVDYTQSLVRSLFSYKNAEYIINNIDKNDDIKRGLSYSLPTLGRIAPIVGRNNYEKFYDSVKNDGFFEYKKIDDYNLGVDLWLLAPTDKAYNKMWREIEFIERSLGGNTDLGEAYGHVRISEVMRTVEKSITSNPKEDITHIEDVFVMLHNAAKMKKSRRNKYYMTFKNRGYINKDWTIEAFFNPGRPYNIRRVDDINRRIKKICKEHSRFSDFAFLLFGTAVVYYGQDDAMSKIERWLSKNEDELMIDIAFMETNVSSPSQFLISSLIFPAIFEDKLKEKLIKEDFRTQVDFPSIETFTLSGGEKVSVLNSRFKLSKEGSEMRHCVSGYWNAVSSKKCIILSIKEKGDQSRRSERWTIELYQSYKKKHQMEGEGNECDRYSLFVFRQVKGYCNVLMQYDKFKKYAAEIVDVMLHHNIMIVGISEAFKKEDGEVQWLNYVSVDRDRCAVNLYLENIKQYEFPQW